jgi:hypothetical protein
MERSGTNFLGPIMALIGSLMRLRLPMQVTGYVRVWPIYADTN